MKKPVVGWGTPQEEGLEEFASRYGQPMAQRSSINSKRTIVKFVSTGAQAGINPFVELARPVKEFRARLFRSGRLGKIDKRDRETANWRHLPNREANNYPECFFTRGDMATFRACRVVIVHNGKS